MSEAINYKEFETEISNIVDSFPTRQKLMDISKEERKELCETLLKLMDNNKTKASNILGISRRSFSRYLDDENKVNFNNILGLTGLEEFDNDVIKYWRVLLSSGNKNYILVVGTEREIELTILLSKALDYPYISSFVEEVINKNSLPKEEISHIRNFLLNHYRYMMENNIKLRADYSSGKLELKRIQ